MRHQIADVAKRRDVPMSDIVGLVRKRPPTEEAPNIKSEKRCGRNDLYHCAFMTRATIAGTSVLMKVITSAVVTPIFFIADIATGFE